MQKTLTSLGMMVHPILKQDYQTVTSAMNLIHTVVRYVVFLLTLELEGVRHGSWRLYHRGVSLRSNMYVFCDVDGEATKFHDVAYVRGDRSDCIRVHTNKIIGTIVSERIRSAEANLHHRLPDKLVS